MEKLEWCKGVGKGPLGLCTAGRKGQGYSNLWILKEEGRFLWEQKLTLA